MKKAKLYLVISLILTIAFTNSSCCAPDKYNETCIKGGELITSQLLVYIDGDTNLTSDEKRILKESCAQYLLMLKQQ